MTQHPPPGARRWWSTAQATRGTTACQVMDDGSLFTYYPGMVAALLDAYDTACAQDDAGGARKIPKATATVYATYDQIAHVRGGLVDIRKRATRNTPSTAGATLGVALGGKQHPLHAARRYARRCSRAMVGSSMSRRVQNSNSACGCAGETFATKNCTWQTQRATRSHASRPALTPADGNSLQWPLALEAWG